MLGAPPVLDRAAALLAGEVESELLGVAAELDVVRLDEHATAKDRGTRPVEPAAHAPRDAGGRGGGRGEGRPRFARGNGAAVSAASKPGDALAETATLLLRGSGPRRRDPTHSRRHEREDAGRGIEELHVRGGREIAGLRNEEADELADAEEPRREGIATAKTKNGTGGAVGEAKDAEWRRRGDVGTLDDEVDHVAEGRDTFAADDQHGDRSVFADDVRRSSMGDAADRAIDSRRNQ